MALPSGNEPKTDNPSLAELLRQRSIGGILLAMAFGALIMYGTSGVIYFSNQIWATPNPLMARMNRFIVEQNLIAGAVAALMSSLLGPRVDRLRVSLGLRHLALSLLVVLVWFFLQGFLFYMADGPRLIRELKQAYPTYNQLDAPWYLYMLGPLVVSNLFFYFQRQGKQLTHKLTEQAFRLSQLEQLKTRAELEALQARINPHFLYNSLNSIASLVHEEPDRAERMVLLLSKLFRYTTGLRNQYFNSVANELEMVRTYLDVEQVRFGDRLTYRIDLADETLRELRIPQFLLQPLVENAIKHGVSKVAGPGGIILRIAEEAGWLSLCIHDNGPAFPEQLVAGYGLHSIQEKLRLLYGEDARLSVNNRPRKEIVIQIRTERLNSTKEELTAQAPPAFS